MATVANTTAGRLGRTVPPWLGRLGDERLARTVAAGEDRAFVVLYDRYHQQLYRYCRSIVRDDSDAQDALQSALAAALVALRCGQRNAPVRPWLYRIAHNESISLLRRRRSQLAAPIDEEGRAAAYAEDRVGERERISILFEDLRELPERARGALLMRELSGLSYEDIGVALETTPGAARQAVLEARKGLHEFQEGRAMRCEEVMSSISNGDRRVLRGRKLRAHLRDCTSCTAFETAISSRRSELNAIAPLLPAASAAMLSQLIGTGSSHGVAGGGGVAAAAAGKTAAGSLAAKTLAGVAVASIAITTGARLTQPPSLRQGSNPAVSSRVPQSHSRTKSTATRDTPVSAQSSSATRRAKAYLRATSTRRGHTAPTGSASGIGQVNHGGGAAAAASTHPTARVHTDTGSAKQTRPTRPVRATRSHSTHRSTTRPTGPESATRPRPATARPTQPLSTTPISHTTHHLAPAPPRWAAPTNPAAHPGRNPSTTTPSPSTDTTSHPESAPR